VSEKCFHITGAAGMIRTVRLNAARA